MEYDRKLAEEKAQMIAQGLVPEKERLLKTSASDASWKGKKKSKKEEKRSKSFGWDQYNQEAQYNAHTRRLASVPFDEENYNKQKEELAPEEFYRDAHNLSYGQAPKVADSNVKRMVDELENQILKRQNYSRKRKNVDDHEYVDYISSRNKNFNKKISKAFDPYTVEIKNNLERGTAL